MKRCGSWREVRGRTTRLSRLKRFDRRTRHSFAGKCRRKTADMIRIALTPAAFEAIAATLPVGSVAVEPDVNAKGERLIWLEAAMVDRIGANARAW